MYEISSIRHRFSSAGVALEAASAFDALTEAKHDYEIHYSEGETSGWTVEVRRAGDRSYHLGNLAPIVQVEPEMDVLRAYYTSGKKRFHRDFPVPNTHERDPAVRASAISFAMGAAVGREKFVNHVFLTQEQARATA